jgi:hypothetical protein
MKEKPTEAGAHQERWLGALAWVHRTVSLLGTDAPESVLAERTVVLVAEAIPRD